MSGSSAYALAVALAVLFGSISAGAILYARGVRVGRAIALVSAAAVAAIVGAKCFSVAERGGIAWAAPAWELTHGYRYPGALLGLTAAAPIFARLLPARLSIGALADVLAVILPFAMVLVRLGCFYAGCCHGVPAATAWSVRYPAPTIPWRAHVQRGWIEPADAWSLAVHPLQLYFAAAALGVGVLTLLAQRRHSRAGNAFLLFLLLDGVAKSALETLRLDFRPALVMASAAMALLAGVGLITRRPPTAAS